MNKDGTHNSFEDMIKHVNKNVELFSSQELADSVKQRHFSNGVPIHYIDPERPDEILAEYPDGTKKVVKKIKRAELTF